MKPRLPILLVIAIGWPSSALISPAAVPSTQAAAPSQLETAESRLDQGSVRVESGIRHVRVYSVPGRFGGWPANHGIWSWGDEILVGFSAGYHKDLGENRHAIDRERPEEHLFARSLDGGVSWKIEDPSSQGVLIPTGTALHGVPPPGLIERPWTDCPGGIDFLHPDFAMAVRMTSASSGPARFFYSRDRGHHWEGPFRLPLPGLPGLAPRTDYVVGGRSECTLFVTAPKANGAEGRPLCMRTSDGGRTWQFVGWIGPEPQGYAIMPSTVANGPREYLSAVRCRLEDRSWIDLWRSCDDGANWELLSRPAPDTGEGNPASLLHLRDGRICLTYGHRARPFGIHARLSEDGGRSWGPKWILREDGGGRDVGYPRSIQRPDGMVVTVYYFHDEPKGFRYIGATIWDPAQRR